MNVNADFPTRVHQELLARLGPGISDIAQASAVATVRLAIETGLNAEHDEEFVGYATWCMISALAHERRVK